jgi:hypothetical protein
VPPGTGTAAPCSLECLLVRYSWQKGKGMHWSGETSDALAALSTLKQNQEWERYWQQPAGQLALLAAAA